MLPSEAKALTDSGIATLRRSDPQAASAALGRVVAAGHADATAHLALAYAHAMLKEPEQALRAVDADLALEPRHLRALLLKADLFHQTGNGPAAATFYQAVTKCVPEGAQLPPDLQQEVVRAQGMCEHYMQRFETSLRAQLAAASAAKGPASARFAQSVDILLVKRQIYVQQPKQYYFPELPTIQFHHRARLR